MIIGSPDLFCDEDIDYAQKLMEAGVFTELYAEPGVPHGYDAPEGTAQTERVNALRDQGPGEGREALSLQPIRAM